MFLYNICFFTVFFYWKQMENKKIKIVMVYVIQFPRKWCLFQPSRSKTVGEDTFLAAKVSFFWKREK